MLIESVPNVSEGRRPEVLDTLEASVRHTPGAFLLHRTADVDHHRSVFTMAGSQKAILDAVLALVGAAVRLIDLRAHEGEHPCVGAVDVIPFVPLGDVPMDVCIETARTAGARIAREFAVPVFLYESAASAPHRRRLELIRRGGLAALADRMRQREWAPDFGPARPHPTAGVTVVGARRPLIAFNVNLDTTRLDVARSAAAAVRESSGGLRAVKAIGVTLASRRLVQVSMNLTDYTVTPLDRAFSAVRQEAARHGVEVLESELIGLVPEDAISGIDPVTIGLKGVGEGQVLERRLRTEVEKWKSGKVEK
ncbi:MAG: glutamate formimidoyltransferase [Acidimicrobiia bacterium]|nr:glutamate formimidoyltransferase [Acidimicrobiia bacterium]